MRSKLIVLLLLLVLLPVLAQDSTTHTVAFDGFSFSYDSGLANHINITQVIGGEDTFPPEASHTQFILYNQAPAPESIFDAIGGIRAYRTADFAGLTAHEDRLAQLQSILDERPDLAQYEAIARDPNENVLPFIPVFPAGQVIRAKTQYVETDAVEGIAYITIYQEAAEPFLNDSFIYTFQGISTDGMYYVSAIFSLVADVDFLSAEPPADFDMETFMEQLPEYLAKNTAWLDEAPPDAFSPSLTSLDTLFQSFVFGE